MGTQLFESLGQACTWAAEHGLREKAVCFVVRGEDLLVFDHVPAEDSGVQLPAGGLESDETPAQAAIRELHEESGLILGLPVHLRSYEWKAQLPDRWTQQVCHAFAFTAPPTTPEAWQCRADEHRFAFRWAPVSNPGLDWEMDAALPDLQLHLSLSKSLSKQESR